MSKNPTNTIDVAGVKRRVSILPDFPDLRDRIYEPGLLEVPIGQVPNPKNLIIRDQGKDGSCVGFALAAVLNLQLQQRGQLTAKDGVSPLMLFEMAKQHDEWTGTNYNYSSPRGALKGFFHNGVCLEPSAPYDTKPASDKPWAPSVAASKEAREVSLGAYYRLRPNLVDYHCALAETGALLVSLQTHRGWAKPTKGKIKLSYAREGGHAVAIVGYNADGFIIQNSWGSSWGKYGGAGGLALLTYEDWSENIIDGWVLRLGVSSPSAFEFQRANHRNDNSNDASLGVGQGLNRRQRNQIKGHYIHINDAKFVNTSPYVTNAAEIEETARHLRINAKKYKHLAFHFHGGLVNTHKSADQIYRVKEKYKQQGIYPIHVMWETGFTEQIKDIIVKAMKNMVARIGQASIDTDEIIEGLCRELGGRAIWGSIKDSANRAFSSTSPFPNAMTQLIGAAQASDMRVHLSAHSAGAVFCADMLDYWAKRPKSPKFETVTLWAPACGMARLNGSYAKSLANGHVGKIEQINLREDHELDDDCFKIYRKSLLELVSRALEVELNAPLAGLSRFNDQNNLLQQSKGNYNLYITGQKGCPTDIRTHGGFGLDVGAQNHLLSTILNKSIDGRNGFKTRELEQ